MKYYKFQLFVDSSHFCFDLFLPHFQISLLTFIILFTWVYYISTWVEIFHIIAIFFNSVYWVEISTQDENLHIMSPLAMYCTLFQHISSLWRTWLQFSTEALVWRLHKMVKNQFKIPIKILFFFKCFLNLNDSDSK